MSDAINLKRTVELGFDVGVERLTKALQEQGFGVLTRIDLDAKVREKLGKSMPRATILGACNPTLAYEAYSANADVASLLPCNAVVRDLGGGRISIELAKPTALMRILGDEKLVELARAADDKLTKAIQSL